MKLTETLTRLRHGGDADKTAPDPELQALRYSYELYRGRAPHVKEGRGLPLAAVIASELSRLTLTELRPHFGPTHADRLLREAMLPLFDRLKAVVEYACACGGVIFKPCYDGKRLTVDTVLPFDFQVLGTDGSGNLTACAFRYRHCEGGKEFLRIEEHRPDGDGYRITNRLYDEDGKERPLTAIGATASLSPEVQIENGCVPLFSYFAMPQGNPDFPGSPLGVPVFRRAEGLMREADRQFERLLWEFEGGELAVDASEDAFRLGRDGKPQLPVGKERLYRVNALDACCSSHPLLSVFAPNLRDKSLINGLNRLLMAVEDACGVARGTVSDPSEVAKTATEVKAMRQRTFATVSAIQGSLSRALLRLAEAMTAMAQLYGLWEGVPTLTVDFGDGVLSDSESERAAEREEVKAGILSAKEFKAKWYGGKR